MRFITGRRQAQIYQAIVEIIKVLSSVDTVEATDAICDAYNITYIVGGKQMTKLLRGANRIKPVTANTMSKWGNDEVLSYIQLLEEIVDQETSKVQSN